MRVSLITMTEKPIRNMYISARTCYSEKSPIELLETSTTDEEKQWKLVEKVLSSGHQSIAENINFTFGIEGISRACGNQLVRHRAGVVYAQQSQRYVEYKESLEELLLLKESKDIEKIEKVLNKYFVINNDIKSFKLALLDTMIEYRTLIEKEGLPAEEARAILPNATKTNLTMTINLRELMHVCNLRLCTRAQKEIRELFQNIKKEVMKVNEKIGNMLVPSCEVNGFCIENKCCGRKPSISTILNNNK